MTTWKKSDDEGKKEQKERTGKKNNFVPKRSLKCKVHRHTLLEECVVRIMFLSFNSAAYP
jgi:hypothetical protein